MNYATLSACRACGAGDLRHVLSLGDQPLANALKRGASDVEDRYPLTLMLCPACGLVQIAETVDKSRLFSHYVWVTGTSSTARAFSRRFCDLVTAVRPLSSGDLVLEVASNDGTFLKPFIDRGVRAIGVDPAANIVAMANADGVTTRCAFWDEATAAAIVETEGRAKMVIARNVLAHVSDLHGVVAGIRRVLHDDGVAAIEFHAALNILEELQYDSIYHEHLCYFSATSFSRVLAMHDLHPFHVDFSPISGGAQIVYCSSQPRPATVAYTTLMERERTAGVCSADAWEGFSRRCVAHRERSREMAARFAGRTVLGFGASARSATYLNFCGFTTDQISAIVDNSPLKSGCFTPGSAIPIVSADEGFHLKPELLFVLAWNFKDEIVELCQKRGYRGDFLVPFPETPYVVTQAAETLR